MRSRALLFAAVFVGVGTLCLWAATAGKDDKGDGKASPARAITDPAQEPMVEASEIVRQLSSAHQGVAGALRWDAARSTLIINVVGDPTQPGRSAAAFAKDVENARLGVGVQFRSVKFSTEQLDEVVEKLTRTRGVWAPAIDGWIYTAPDEKNGRVVVGVDHRYLSLWRQAAATLEEAVPVAVQSESPTGAGVILE